MGFYGNISNVGRTNMVFDRIYSSRQAMDANAAKDGVYAGRYVLVEYDQDNKKDTHIQFYLKGTSFNTDGTIKIDNSTICFIDKECFHPLKIEIGKGYFFKNSKIEYLASGGSNDTSGTITSLNGDSLIDSYLLFTIEGEDINARSERYEEVKHILYYFKDDSTALNCQNEVYDSNRIYYTKKSGYQTNYHIDFQAYTETYDSTVWIKQYDSDGNPKYVNIASLNSVVPTFDVLVDAPTAIPKLPYFDEDSTNIYYNLHVQPQWGFRVKNAEDGSLSDVEGIDGNKKAIYFNKQGFDKNTRNAYVDLNEAGEDSINISLAKSGQLYGKPETEENDIQELSINLPSIGNMMSEAWDYIYGPERDSYMGQWKTKEDLVDKSIFINNAVDNEGYILEGNERKDFSSFDGRIESISRMEGLTIPIKTNASGELVGAFLNENNGDIRLAQLQAREEAELATLELDKEINGWTEEEYLSHKLIIEKKYLNEKGKIANLMSDDSWIETSVHPGDNEKAPSIQIHHKKKLQDAVQTSWPPDFWGNEIKFGEEIAWNVYTIDMAGHINQVIPMTMHLPKSGMITLDENPTEEMHAVTKKYFDEHYTSLSTEVGKKVPTTRTINGLSLASDIELTPSLIGAVPVGRTVNKKSLASDISLSASDVGALSEDAAVLKYDSTQALTDAQKKQVKDNLGLEDGNKLIVIAGDKDGNINYTYHQILDFYQNNQNLIFVYKEVEGASSEQVYSLIEVSSGKFTFYHTNPIQGQSITESYTYITLSGEEETVVEYVTNTLNVNNSSSGGTNNTIVVSPISQDSDLVNYSSSEIYTYLQSGNNVIFRQLGDFGVNDFTFDKYDAEKQRAIFVAPAGISILGPNHLMVPMIYINSDKTYSSKSKYIMVDEGTSEIDPPDVE